MTKKDLRPEEAAEKADHKTIRRMEEEIDKLCQEKAQDELVTWVDVDDITRTLYRGPKTRVMTRLSTLSRVFVLASYRKLVENIHKGDSYRDLELDQLWDLMNKETDELFQAVDNVTAERLLGKSGLDLIQNYSQVMREAADVANYCLFIWIVARDRAMSEALKLEKKRQEK